MLRRLPLRAVTSRPPAKSEPPRLLRLNSWRSRARRWSRLLEFTRSSRRPEHHVGLLQIEMSLARTTNGPCPSASAALRRPRLVIQREATKHQLHGGHHAGHDGAGETASASARGRTPEKARRHVQHQLTCGLRNHSRGPPAAFSAKQRAVPGPGTRRGGCAPPCRPPSCVPWASWMRGLVLARVSSGFAHAHGV